MTTAKSGDLVFVHYTGKFETGEVFDSSKDRDPLCFVLGRGDIIEGFDTAIQGMEVGDTKTITLTPDMAYGDYAEDRIVKTDRENFGGEFEPEVDLQLALQLENGERTLATIKAFDEKTVTLDLNHPLAGKTLKFDLELMNVKDASEVPTCGTGGCDSCSSCGEN
ncbi:MAG: FKBP-type peptidyl-prolyl cis-trans isomerase [Candidatus Rifleibacteriota bacterium]